MLVFCFFLCRLLQSHFLWYFFSCTLKVCNLWRRRRIKYPNLHCSRGVWVCDCVRAVQSSDWGRYLLWDFLLSFFFRNDILKFAVLSSLALWTCCYLFKWPRMVIDCMFAFLPFTYILMIYWSYLCFTTLMWCVCMCVWGCTHLSDCFHAICLFNCCTPHAQVFAQSPQMSFLLSTVSLFPSIPHISFFSLSSTTKFPNRRECGLFQNHFQIYFCRCADGSSSVVFSPKAASQFLVFKSESEA